MTDLLLYHYPGSICSQMARLALVEKGVDFRLQTIDIMKTSEQFEPWYTALNPAAVVPTLKIDDQIVTDTINIVNRIDTLPGPDLGLGLGLDLNPLVQDWLRRIMGLHYGVLLYSAHLADDRTSPTMISRAAMLSELGRQRPDLAQIVAKRLAGNARLQATLKDPAKVDAEFATSRGLVEDMDTALNGLDFLCGDAYSLADCFATAALARFRMHGFDSWWSDGENPHVAAYYDRMKSRRSFATASVSDAST
jgi:glutathione S-transferase